MVKSKNRMSIKDLIKRVQKDLNSQGIELNLDKIEIVAREIFRIIGKGYVNKEFHRLIPIGFGEFLTGTRSRSEYNRIGNFRVPPVRERSSLPPKHVMRFKMSRRLSRRINPSISSRMNFTERSIE